MANKLILIEVDEEIHRKFKAALKRKGNGRRVKYTLGRKANSAMKRMTDVEEGK